MSQTRTEKGVKSIIDVILTLGHIGIPLGGNWIKDEQKEDGNLVHFVEWKSRFDSDLADHLKYHSKAGKYLSPQIQNEIIAISERKVRESIVNSISKYWSLMADETQDCATQEQLSICVRFVKHNEVCEEFLEFVELEKLDAQTIADTLTSTLSDWGLDMQNLVGQGYDGAAVMSSVKMAFKLKFKGSMKTRPMSIVDHMF